MEKENINRWQRKNSVDCQLGHRNRCIAIHLERQLVWWRRRGAGAGAEVAAAAAVEGMIWDDIWVLLGTRRPGLVSLIVVSSRFTRSTDTDDGGDYDCKCSKNTCHRRKGGIRRLRQSD